MADDLLPHLLDIKGAIGRLEGKQDAQTKTTADLKADINGYRASLEGWKKEVSDEVKVIKSDQDSIRGGIKVVKGIGLVVPILSGAAAWVTKHLGT